MPWARKRYKDGKVYACVDDAGRLVVRDGLVEIKYREEDTRTYRARASAVRDLDAPEPTAPDAPAPPRPARPPRKTSGVPVLSRPRPGSVVVYTDGACAGNPGPAGIGAVLVYGDHRKEISEYLGEGTNNIAELTAILRALQAIRRPDRPVDVCIDSSYSIGVLARGWKAKANRDLIAEIQDEMGRFADLAFVKVPGHAGIRENERADELAREAIRRATGRAK